MGRNEERDFKGQKLSNATHASVTDPEAKLYRKSSQQGADLYYMGHTLMENRNGLVVEATVTQASGTAEREAALAMVKKVVQKKGKKQRITLGADKGYDTQDLVEALQGLQVTPHVAQNNTNRASAIDGRTTRHPGYTVSLRIRKRVEEIFGWMKTVGNYRSPSTEELTVSDGASPWSPPRTIWCECATSWPSPHIRRGWFARSPGKRAENKGRKPENQSPKQQN